MDHYLRPARALQLSIVKQLCDDFTGLSQLNNTSLILVLRVSDLPVLLSIHYFEKLNKFKE